MIGVIDIGSITINQILGWSIPAVFGIIAFLKRNELLFPIFNRIVVKIKSLCQATKNGDKLDAIMKELKPNGGSSLRDAIDKLQKSSKESEKAIKEMSKELVFLKKRSETRDERNEISNFETDAKGECIWANKHYLQLCGLSLEEVLGNGWANVIDHGDREKVFQEWGDAIKYKRDFHMKFNYKNYSMDLVFPVKVDAYVIKNGDGEVLGWLGYVKKIQDFAETQKI